jgi:hypothetical protein
MMTMAVRKPKDTNIVYILIIYSWLANCVTDQDEEECGDWYCGW